MAVDEAEKLLQLNALEHTEHAALDLQREARLGIPEIVYGSGKSADQVVEIVGALLKHQDQAIVTRASDEAMSEQWRLFRNITRPLSTAEGLAVDDTLPQSVARHNSSPILHLYTFVPSVIVAKYQDIEAALRIERCRARNIEFNRRSTGGGTVIMGPEIVALGLGINMDYPGLKKGVGGVFESLSRVLIRALDSVGIAAYFQPKTTSR